MCSKRMSVVTRVHCRRTCLSETANQIEKRSSGADLPCHLSFYSDMSRLWRPDYRPTEQDILRVRVKTSGISETKFLVGELTYS